MHDDKARGSPPSVQRQRCAPRESPRYGGRGGQSRLWRGHRRAAATGTNCDDPTPLPRLRQLQRRAAGCILFGVMAPFDDLDVGRVPQHLAASPANRMSRLTAWLKLADIRTGMLDENASISRFCSGSKPVVPTTRGCGAAQILAKGNVANGDEKSITTSAWPSSDPERSTPSDPLPRIARNCSPTRGCLGWSTAALSVRVESSPIS